MTESGLRFSASDGKSIAYSRVLPGGQPCALALVGHGMNDHGARFMSLADSLAELGMAVYIPDLRGHGDTDSGTDRGFLAETDGFERTVEDLIELGDFAAKEMGGLPLYYFGHSFGALLGMALAAMYGKYLEGVVLSAPPEKPSAFLDFAGTIVVRSGIRFKGLRAPAELPKSMSFGAYNKNVHGARTGSDWISRDASAVAAYVADPKCAFTCTYGFYRDLMHGIRKVYAPGFLQSLPTNLPLYLFCGSADPVIGMKAGFEKIVGIFKGVGLVDFEAKCYEGGRHESLNEINKDEVLADIAEWFGRHIA